VSHEFLVAAQSGEDSYFRCEKCGHVFAEKETNTPECIQCGTLLSKVSAMEIGHIFKLRQKYSEAFNLKYLDEAGSQKPVEMGCYGIGVSRLLPAIIEQNHDGDGIIWPKEVAPFKVLVLAVNISDETLAVSAQRIYEHIDKKNIAVLFDDRDVRAGIKFKDADLLGIPLRITIGDKFKKEKKVEVKFRDTKEVVLVSENELDALLESR